MKILFVCKGLNNVTVKLQPWYFIYHLAAGMTENDCHVSIATDQNADYTSQGIIMHNINRPFMKNISEFAEELNPDFIIWNYGVTSAIVLFGKKLKKYKHIAVLTSPKYSFLHLLKTLKLIGLKSFIRSLDSLLIHIIGTFIPWSLLKTNIRLNGFKSVIVLSSRAKQAICSLSYSVYHILPTLNTVIPYKKSKSIHREQIGIKEDDTVILYAGNPLPLRGSGLLLESFIKAAEKDNKLFLILLLRRERDFGSYVNKLKEAAKNSGFQDRIMIKDQSLSREERGELFRLCDIVALPFIIMPSEAPITILEAHFFGKPVIVADVPGISDLLLPGDIVVRPISKKMLVRVLIDRTWFNPISFRLNSWKNISADFLVSLRNI